MNTGALKDRSGEDVELNSCFACAAGSCYACVTVSATTIRGQVSGQVVKSGGQGDETIMVKLDITRINALLEFCEEPRTRIEIQEFCEIKSRDYFRKNILVPLISSGRLRMTIPDKPNSSKQKYVKV